MTSSITSWLLFQNRSSISLAMPCPWDCHLCSRITKNSVPRVLLGLVVPEHRNQQKLSCGSQQEREGHRHQQNQLCTCHCRDQRYQKEHRHIDLHGREHFNHILHHLRNGESDNLVVVPHPGPERIGPLRRGELRQRSLPLSRKVSCVAVALRPSRSPDCGGCDGCRLWCFVVCVGVVGGCWWETNPRQPRGDEKTDKKIVVRRTTRTPARPSS